MVKGYETLVSMLAPINVRLSLILTPDNNGFAVLTGKSKSNSRGPKFVKMAVKETTGSLDTFFKVISISGPPGVNGGSGPNADTILIGC
jgi:hypothetical protein